VVGAQDEDVVREMTCRCGAVTAPAGRLDRGRESHFFASSARILSPIIVATGRGSAEVMCSMTLNGSTS
jgi:hypothetical protein